jgi:hypothetical protein
MYVPRPSSPPVLCPRLPLLHRVPGHQEESEAANRARQEVHSALCRCWQLQHVALRKFQIFRRKKRRKFGRCRGTDDQVFARKAQEHTGACFAPLPPVLLSLAAFHALLFQALSIKTNDSIAIPIFTSLPDRDAVATAAGLAARS